MKNFLILHPFVFLETHTHTHTHTIYLYYTYAKHGCSLSTAHPHATRTPFGAPRGNNLNQRRAGMNLRNGSTKIECHEIWTTSSTHPHPYREANRSPFSSCELLSRGKPIADPDLHPPTVAPSNHPSPIDEGH
jgi:hypothetical protein